MGGNLNTNIIASAEEEAYPGSINSQEVPKMKRKLTAQNRCDRCSAAALAYAELEELYLQFCGHHLASSRESLEAQGWSITDPAEDELNTPVAEVTC